MTYEVVQKLDMLDVMLRQMGNGLNISESWRYQTLLGAAMKKLSREEQVAVVLGEDVIMTVNSSCTEQLAPSACVPPEGYLLRPWDNTELLTEDHIIFISLEQAWVKPHSTMIGKPITATEAAALRPEGYNPQNENFTEEAMVSRNAATASANNLQKVNPFARSSHPFMFFERGWRNGAEA
ncbi:hypothetical protein HNP46_000392 [Pseudomonas nitritireducens]|uniref:Uncharacterized protein n=1 Tax=Pseudomonas nitroreducens TaxID=46680 RepID=A0A7W7KEW6_PSENT|nr:hypothetical protein [Pseudomonas nitritireducens]MBB4861581.1 hypothetical protein [Pseudomonas nitritireducens]